MSLFRFTWKILKSNCLFQHVCPSAGNNLAPTKYIFTKFYIGGLLLITVKKIQVWLKKKSDTLHEELSMFYPVDSDMYLKHKFISAFPWQHFLYLSIISQQMLFKKNGCLICALRMVNVIYIIHIFCILFTVFHYIFDSHHKNTINFIEFGILKCQNAGTKKTSRFASELHKAFLWIYT